MKFESTLFLPLLLASAEAANSRVRERGHDVARRQVEERGLVDVAADACILILADGSCADDKPGDGEGCDACEGNHPTPPATPSGGNSGDGDEPCPEGNPPVPGASGGHPPIPGASGGNPPVPGASGGHQPVPLPAASGAGNGGNNNNPPSGGNSGNHSNVPGGEEPCTEEVPSPPGNPVKPSPPAAGGNSGNEGGEDCDCEHEHTGVYVTPSQTWIISTKLPGPTGITCSEGQVSTYLPSYSTVQAAGNQAHSAAASGAQSGWASVAPTGQPGAGTGWVCVPAPGGSSEAGNDNSGNSGNSANPGSPGNSGNSGNSGQPPKQTNAAFVSLLDARAGFAAIAAVAMFLL